MKEIKLKDKVNWALGLTVFLAILIVSSVYTYSRYTYTTSTNVNITVSSSEKCSSLGITKLSECLLLMDNTANTVEDAKAIIESKEEVDTTRVEPVTAINSIGVLSDTSASHPGLFSTTDDYGTSYYYRGNVTNNYVFFAGFYWRIIRINGDGSIRLIYDGTEAHANGESSDDRQIGTSRFNENYNDNTYVGYMIGSTDALTYDDTHSNINDSTIKSYIDDWYEEHLIDYEDYLSDEIFCNDRSISSGTGIGTTTTYYSGYDRLYTNKSPVLTCTNQNDRFTVNDTTNGNGDLTYPIGLITADEVSLVGGVYDTENTFYYLYTGQTYWTMTPSQFTSSNNYAGSFNLNSTGDYYINAVTTTYGVRPVINLSADIYMTEGTGTMNDPYQVSLTEPTSETLSNLMLLNSTGEETVDDAETAIEKKGDPDYSTTATTDEGLYATEDNYGTSYYYRGAVEDNYVYFAGYYWRIVRRNGDGSVRLIYDGTEAHSNGEIDTDRYISGWSDSVGSYVDMSYFGSSFSGVDTIYYSDGESGGLKYRIDGWYSKYIANTEYENYIYQNGEFCNDTEVYSDDSYTMMGNYYYNITYTPYNRVTNYIPTLECSSNYIYSINVGTLSVDEVIMAGGVNEVDNTNYYLYIGYEYFTMSPYLLRGGSYEYNYIYATSSTGSITSVGGGMSAAYAYAKPVINISSDVLVASGNGTKDEPYSLKLPD